MLHPKRLQARAAETHSRFKQSGLSVSLSTPAISLLETASSLADAAGKTSDGRMQALAAGAAALNVYNNKQALQSLANGEAPKAEVSVAITVGSSKSQSDSYQSSSTAKASQLQAGGKVNMTATGAGENSNILVQGSDILAGTDASLIADNQINLLSSQNTSRDRSSNSSSSAAVGVAIKIGQGGLEAGITANASKGRGHANSDDLLHDNSHVTAGKQLTIQSGGDTTMQGAVVSADKVIADIGGDFNLESLQDTSLYAGKQQSLGGSVTFGAGFSASASYSNSKAKGDFASVTEQTSIQAGAGGFQINVKGNTDLKGAVIASSQAAVDKNLNRLSTGTLTHSELENHSDHQASAVNLSGGFSVGGKEPDKSAGSTVGKGASWSWQNQGKSGVKGAAAGVSSDSGSESSTTRSAISQGQFAITNESSQQALTGQSAVEAIASIDREVLTGDNGNGLSKTWDGQALMQEQAANAEIMAAFGQQAGQAIGTSFEAKANELRDQADTKQGEEKQALLDEAKKWDEGGAYRVIAHTAAGALGGGVAGAVGAAGASKAASLLNEIQGNIADNLAAAGASADAAKVTAQMVTGALATGIGAVASGGSTTGAATALNADFNNRQLHKVEKLRIKELARGDAEKEARLTAAACALIKCYAEYPVSSQAYGELKAMADIGASASFAAEREQLQQQHELFAYSTTGMFNDESVDATKKFDNTYQVTTRTLGAGQAALGVAGVIGAATTAPVSCATGVGCVAIRLSPRWALMRPIPAPNKQYLVKAKPRWRTRHYKAWA